MPEKILIVDDDIDSLKLIGLMLQRQGYEITAANAGGQAISKATAEKPDLIILDVMMPDMDGYEVCRHLRADPNTQDIPIIMFTAKTLVDDKVAGFEAGADDYLTKPTHPAELASRVKAILARNVAQRGPTTDLGTAIAFLGAKGGVGTTTLATNTAIVLAPSYPTILADFRLGQGSLAPSLGFTRQASLAHLASQSARDINKQMVENALTKHTTGLRLLFSSIRPAEAQVTVSPDTAAQIVQQLRSIASLVILDLGTGLTPVNYQILSDIDHLLLVVDPYRLTLNMARAVLTEVETLGLNRDRSSVVLLNRTQSSLQVPWQEAEQILGRDVIAIISPAPELAFQANESNFPIVLFQPNAIVSNQLQKLAEEIGTRVHV